MEPGRPPRGPLAAGFLRAVNVVGVIAATPARHSPRRGTRRVRSGRPHGFPREPRTLSIEQPILALRARVEHTQVGAPSRARDAAHHEPLCGCEPKDAALCDEGRVLAHVLRELPLQRKRRVWGRDGSGERIWGGRGDQPRA